MQRNSPKRKVVSRVAERLMGFHSLDKEEWIEEFRPARLNSVTNYTQGHPALKVTPKDDHHSWKLDPKDPDDLIMIKTYTGTAHLWTCQFIGDSCSVITPGFRAGLWCCVTEKSHDNKDIIVYDDNHIK